MSFIAARITNSEHAEDLTQDVFIRLWKHIDALKPETANALIYKIAHNIIIDRIRHYQKETDFANYLQYTHDLQNNSTEDNNNYKELNSLHKQAIKTLPEYHQTIYLMNFNKGMKQVDIAQELDISAKCVYNTIAHAKRIIREHIRHNYSPSL